jgi:hypothetical protein
MEMVFLTQVTPAFRTAGGGEQTGLQLTASTVGDVERRNG